MNVLHIVGGNFSGGAARGAYWLHEALLKERVESNVLVQSGSSDDQHIVSCGDTILKKSSQKIRAVLASLPLKVYKHKTGSIFSTGLIGTDITKTIHYKKADIIHFHWINNGFINMSLFSQINKPIVWTFRDMWPFTGGCHYAGECTKYTENCGKCYQLGSQNTYDLSWLILLRKKRYLKQSIQPVAISNWLLQCAEKSILFAGRSIKMIPNCIDTDIFRPLDKTNAREILNLPLNKKIILFGAVNSIRDKRKGFEFLYEALKLLQDCDDYHLVVFGAASNAELDNLHFKNSCLGHLSSDIILALAYSAADVFVAPSLEEAFGKTIAESLACGTPVVAFNATGPKDIVKHLECGFLAKPYDTYNLADGIKWVLDDNQRIEKLSENARLRAVEKYSFHQIAAQYIDVYQELL